MKRVAVNGFGRIGRNFFRAYLERSPDYEIVAVNDLGDPKTMAHLLQFDSLLGPLGEEVDADGETITVGDRRLRAFSVPEPAELPWRELDVDIVVESTGRFERRDQAQAHLDAGARTVMISAVAPDADVMVVLGVNNEPTTRTGTGSSRTRRAPRTASRRWRRCSTTRSGSNAAS